MHKVLCELKEDERLFFEQALKFAVGKIEQNLPVYTELFPASASQGLVYPAIENTDWTASFWTGMVWLAYEWTGDSRYREAAEEQLDSFRRRVEERIAVDTHDLGFSVQPLGGCCLPDYRQSGGAGDGAGSGRTAGGPLLSRGWNHSGLGRSE
ncbi:hypothetical protein ACFSQ7_11520 [Paenibacillus rhizoplanae]